MKTLLFPQDVSQLGCAVAEALHDAFHGPTHSNIEPQLVANLVVELPKHINRLNLAGRTTIKAGGVFVHARPLVTCSSFPASTPTSVEIGDLLLIRTLVVDGKIEERRALLLQAKKTTNIITVPSNKNQWHLYEQWPRFTYAARSGTLKSQTRHIQEPDMYDAAKYLLIGSDLTAQYQDYIRCMGWPFHLLCPEICVHHTAQPTKPRISRYRCFWDELIQFIVGNAGKVFDKPAPGTRGWNRVVHDLISETAKAKTTFMGRATQQPTLQSSESSRGSGVLFLALADQADFFMVAGGGNGGDSNGPWDVPNGWDDNDGRGEISVIEVVINREGA